MVPLPDDDGDGLSNSKEVDLGLDPYTPLGGGTGWIAFQAGIDSPNIPDEIYKITIGGKSLTQLTDAPPNEAPMWSPNGEKIAYTSGRDSADNYSLNVMDSDGQNVTGLTATWDTGADPSWYPDSLRISYRKGSNLYSIQLDGSDENLEADLGIEVSDPQVSPDGRSVVFLSWGEDENRDIYRMDIDGRNLTRLTTDPAWDGFPNWSPDGEQIAFVSTRDGDNEIFLMNDDGSNQRQLTENSVSDITPAWSPDGQWIAYSGEGDILVRNMEGTIDFRVTSLAGKEAYPTWQPILAAQDSTSTYLEPTPTLESGESEKKPTYVLWDLSHGPRQSESGVLYEPDGLYSQLKSELESQNIILVSNSKPLEQVNLDPYAMIVIAMTSAEKQNFTAAEAQIIGEFVKRGRSLLILAERPGFPNRIREVTGYYDIDVGQQVISEVTRLEDHPIFTNIDGLYFEFDGGSINVRNRDAQVVASDNGLAAVVVIEDLPGRVVVVGDSNLFDNRGFSRNRQFAIRLFRWLT
jgi:Tol biopolymer transport system component